MKTHKKNPRINQQDRQKITFQGSANPKEISQQCTPTTHTEAVHCQGVLLGVFHPCLWPLKAPGSTFGGRQASRQLSDASTPGKRHKEFYRFYSVKFVYSIMQTLWSMFVTFQSIAAECAKTTFCISTRSAPASRPHPARYIPTMIITHR